VGHFIGDTAYSKDISMRDEGTTFASISFTLEYARNGEERMKS
jgi:hypothetical protein